MHPRHLTLVVLLGFALVLLGLQANGPRQGRQGNAHYEAHEYREAIDAYRLGLQGYTGVVRNDPVYTALQNNLGAALHRQDAFEEASDAFEHALNAASTVEEEARAAYNAGNNAFRRGDRDGALDYYRRALLADPDHEEARHNYEFIKRQRDQEEEDALPGDTEDDEAPPDETDSQQEGEQPPDEGEQPPAPQDMPGGDEDGSLDDDMLPSEIDTTSMTPEQALRILEALELDELDVLRDALRMDAPRRRVEKDW